MNNKYDEDITANRFFNKICVDNKILLETAAMEKWIICLPRQDTIRSDNIAQTDFILAHILIPSDELPDFHFTNLVGQEYRLKEKILIDAKDDSRRVAILFEELYYTKDYFKVRLWCISSPLPMQHSSETPTGLLSDNSSTSDTVPVSTTEEAFNFLIAETNSSSLIKIIRNICGEYVQKKVISEKDSEENLKKEIRLLMDKSFRIVMSRASLRQKFNENTCKLNNLKLSVAFCVSSFTYDVMFRAVAEINADRSEKFNKAMRNMSGITLDELKVSQNYHGIVPAVKKQLSGIVSYKTPSGKIDCLKRAIENARVNDLKPVVDDLLPILVFALVKSGYNHWITTTSYIAAFLSFFTNEFENGYESFLLTTLDAAIYYIMSDNSENSAASGHHEDRKMDKIHLSKDDFLKDLFKQIETNNEVATLQLLNISASNEDEIFNVILDRRRLFGNTRIEDMTKTLCHPLCDCSGCQAKVAENSPNINSTDKHGRSGLHIAASKSYPRMISILIALGANVNAKDENHWTPLHFAASKGHQNVLLLLLHSNAELNGLTKENYSALHLATNNGHSGCVKALLYYSDHMKIPYNINQEDSFGNTALHIASKWGFAEIVETLLEYGASTSVKNKFGTLPVQLSHSEKIKSFLEAASGATGGSTATCTANSERDKEEMDRIAKIRKEPIYSAIKCNDIKLLCYYLGVVHNEADSLHNLTIVTNTKTVQYCDLFRNEDGMGPLQYAAFLDRPEIIKILLQHGAKADSQNEFGQTALHIASYGNWRSVEALLECAAINLIDLQDCYGNTALHFAAKAGAFKATQFLLQHYPDVNIRNKDGLKAAEVARKSMMLNVSALLERTTI